MDALLAGIFIFSFILAGLYVTPYLPTLPVFPIVYLEITFATVFLPAVNSAVIFLARFIREMAIVFLPKALKMR